MPDDFNPYHQWLGLGKQMTKPAPHQLLGLTPGETDIAKIQRAADLAASRVRSQAPGPRTADWTRLLAEIDAAKKSLIAQATRPGQSGQPIRTVPMGPAGAHRPAPRPRSAPAAPSPPPSAPTTAAGTVPSVAYPPPSSHPAGLPVATAATGASAPLPGPVPRTRIAAKMRRARKTSSLVVFAYTVGALMVVAAVVLPLVIILMARDQSRSNSVDTVAPPAVDPSPTPTTPIPATEPPNVPQLEDANVQEPDLTIESPEDEAMPVEEPLSDSPPSEEQPLGDSPPTPPHADPDTPMIPPVAAPANGRQAPTPQQIQQLSSALAAARAALERGRFEEALTRLADIEDLPMLADDVSRYQRLHLLIQYARNFHDELASAVAELKGGDEIPVGTNAAVGVVQTGAEHITLRVAGTNRTYHLEALPTGLAIAIADLRLADSDPISLVVKAAHLASRPGVRDDQLQRARDWFREAKENGADIGDLEQVLDDTYRVPP